jgi:hypothetical protein
MQTKSQKIADFSSQNFTAEHDKDQYIIVIYIA